MRFDKKISERNINDMHGFVLDKHAFDLCCCVFVSLSFRCTFRLCSTLRCSFVLDVFDFSFLAFSSFTNAILYFCICAHYRSQLECICMCEIHLLSAVHVCKFDRPCVRILEIDKLFSFKL